ADQIEAERTRGGPFADMRDLAWRMSAAGKPLTAANLEALATADAFACFGLTRREALWAAGPASQERADRLPGTVTGVRAPVLPGMYYVAALTADAWSTGLAPDTHPVQFASDKLAGPVVLPIDALITVEPGSRGLVSGMANDRQRAATASG